MKKIERNEYKKLIEGASQSYLSLSTNRGVQGHVVDNAYELKDGSILEQVCIRGWMYEYRLWTKEEASEELNYCPRNVKDESAFN